MNQHTKVINNVATVMADGGGFIKDNYEGKDMFDYLVDAPNLDFRPVLGSPLILPNGDYIGAYKPVDDHYWIPGRREFKTSVPIPKDGNFLNRDKMVEGAVMCMLGYLAERHHFYLGRYRDSVEQAGMNDPEYESSTEGEVNIFHFGPEIEIDPGSEYFWRVDAERYGNIYKG